MSAITFPNSPSAGEQWTINGITYTFTDGTWVAVGQSNFYTLPTATAQVVGGVKGGGTDITIANDGVISFSGTIPTVPGAFTGATSGADGTIGLVVQPSAGDEGKYLKGDGTWNTVIGGEVTVQNSGSNLATAATTINFDGAGVTATGTGAVKTITIPGGSGGINDVVDDTTPQLGGDLDTNGHAIFDETFVRLCSPNAGATVVEVSQTSVQYFQQILVEGSKKLTLVGGDLIMQVATGGSSAGNIEIFGGIKDKDSDLGNPGQILSSTGTKVDWIDAPAASGGSVSQTVYSGNVVRQMDAPVAIGMTPPHDNGYTGFTDVATNPQTLPVYSNSAGGTEVTANPMLNALDGDTDTYADMSAYDGSSNWSKITFSNPLGLRSDSSKEITKIRVGYDGTGHFGYNGGNVTTTGTETGVVKEMDIYDGTAIQLDDLYFVSPTVNDKCHVYYVYLITNDVSSHGGTKLTVNKHDIIPGSSATGQNGFILHDTGDLNTDPAGLKLQLTAGTANTVVGVKTDQPRYLVLPLGSTCSLGDKITVMDLGIGYWQNYPYVNERWNPGNATTNPILIFPHDEDGIQGTVRHESYSSSNSAMYQNRFDQANYFGTEDKGLVNQPFHGTPLGISRNGESISVIWCGHEFGWRYLP